MPKKKKKAKSAGVEPDGGGTTAVTPAHDSDQAKWAKGNKGSKGGRNTFNPFDALAQAIEMRNSAEDSPCRVGALTKCALYRDAIFSVADLMIPEECAAAVAAAERTGFEAAVQAASRTHAFRDNDRLLVQQPRLAAALWARVQMFVPAEIDGRRPIGLNKAVRIYRYRPGQRFGQHVDGSVQCPDTGAWSEYTVLVYLNGGGDDELRGGETTFWKGTGKKQTVALSFPPARGACLLHGHGHRCLLHAGEEVQRGVKYLLRSDVMYG